MTLQPGTKLGPFEVLSPIGAGGMGEVYRGRDTRLKRDVAIKVLPESFARDRDRTLRFQREAEVLATLSHSGIAAVYGLEESEGTTALIMELVEGQTLAERLSRGPLELADTVPIARQIADALEAAHAAGIVHRDLKPANVKIRPDGAVKVLDFGLAKAWESAPRQAVDVSASPTITSPAMTMAGVILGTAAYMAPEQARGKPVDKRADIWAFGCVLFEMLTGRRTFGGDDVSDTLAAVLAKDVDWSLLPPNLPGSIGRLLRRCLEKDRNKRLADIADARLDLEDAVVAEAAPPPMQVRTRARWLLPVAVLGGAIFGSAVAWVWRGSSRAVEPARVYRSTVVQPPSTFTPPGIPVRLSLSPDGTMLIMLASDFRGQNRLWIRRFDADEFRPIEGAESPAIAIWSPDSREFAFISSGRLLMRADVSGGRPIQVCQVPFAGSGGAWLPDGRIVVGSTAASGSQGLRACDARGSKEPESLTTPDQTKGEVTDSYPVVIDERHLMFTSYGAAGTLPHGIYATTLGTSERKLLVEGGSNAAYANGYLFWLRGDALVAQRLDVPTLTLTGSPKPVVEQVATGGVSGQSGDFTVSQAGVLMYSSGFQELRSQLGWYDRQGKLLNTIGEPGVYRNPRLSPDNGTIAVEQVGATMPRNRDIWLIDSKRGLPTRLTSAIPPETTPLWTHGGRMVVYSNGADALRQGLGAAERPETTQIGEINFLQDSMPDDRGVLFQRTIAGGSSNSFSLLWADGKAVPLSEGRASFLQPRVSPDGRLLAFVSDESGRPEVYLQEFPVATTRKRVSFAGGAQPVWRPDGRELFFLEPDGTLLSAAVQHVKEISAGDPMKLFTTNVEGRGVGSIAISHQYDVARDGRFLINTVVSGGTASLLNLVVNWPALLDERR